MEKVGGVAPADSAPSSLGAVGVLPQVVQLLGGKVVSTGYDEVVLEVEGLVLVMDEYDEKVGRRGGQPPRPPILFRLQAFCTSVG